MADSAPDPKVEDVLSSVRRLVSGEVQRRVSRPTESAKAPGALVLTEAQRVAEQPKPAAKPDPAKRSLEERIAELEAAVDRGAQEFEPDGSEDPAQNRPDRIVYTRPPSSDEVSDRAALRLSQIALIETGPAADESDGGGKATVPFRHETSRAPQTEAPMAEDVPQPPAQAEVRAFSNPDDVAAGIEARLSKGGQQAAPEAKDVQGSGQGSNENEEKLQENDALKAEDDFDAALSEAVAASISSSEDDGPSEAAPGDFLDQDEVLAYVDPSASEKSDKGGQEDLQAEEPSNEVPASTDPMVGDAAAAAVLENISDEEVLRLLVGRLMREELQGKLGERITQNVRKLVRREVMRALESRDLT